MKAEVRRWMKRREEKAARSNLYRPGCNKRAGEQKASGEKGAGAKGATIDGQQNHGVRSDKRMPLGKRDKRLLEKKRLPLRCGEAWQQVCIRKSIAAVCCARV